jgi:thiamine kinase-like enzyme
MWCVNTPQASYAIKQLSTDIDLNNNQVRQNYELTERIAFLFHRQGIPAVSALEKAGKRLIEVEGEGFLVFPWVEATALHKDAISENHALKIAQVLANIHTTNLIMPEIPESTFDLHTSEKILALIQKAESCHCPFAPELTKNQKNILEINDTHDRAIPFLKKNTVVSHGDLDQKNVLWDKQDQPILVDWECARKLNPTYEIMNAALDWSGITTHFDNALFFNMIQTYQKAGSVIQKDHLEAIFDGILNNWLNWMLFNVERACVAEESEQKHIGIEQVTIVLPAIVHFKQRVPELIRELTN